MFTGLVQYTFPIRIDSLRKRIDLFADADFLGRIRIGDSIAIDGICLTVVGITAESCYFEISAETIAKTYLSAITGDRLANVELSIQYGDYLGGHLMSGHVHGIGSMVSLDADGNFWVQLETPGPIKYKGSIAINGVSLTIAEIKDSKIRIALIPETLRRTNLGRILPGEKVNLEFDLPVPTVVHDDSFYMNLARIEGEKGRQTAPPNPWVGCVIVKDGQIVSTGYHVAPGLPHAEVNAITSVASVEGATLYVTLEPCCHSGRTPPCTDLLIERKIARVVIGVMDPDPRVTGKGIQTLQEAGIAVTVLDDSAVKDSLRYYLHQRRTGRPFCTLKIALSLDHCYRSTDNRWITNTESRKEGHRIRSTAQAVIVGARTAQYDQPELTVRYDLPVVKQPLRVIVDGAILTYQGGYANTLLLTTASLSPKWPPEVNRVIMESTSPTAILEALQDNLHCLIEGGPTLQRSFLDAECIDEMVIFRSSKILGEDAYRWELPTSLQLTLLETKILDGDVMERYRVEYIPAAPLSTHYVLDEVERAVEEFARGGMVLVVDDESRENEGDLIVAATMMTESHMLEMLNHGTGIICVPMTPNRAQELNLPLMCARNTDHHQTAFTVSVDATSTTTGVSCRDRLATVKALVRGCSTDLSRPGHIYPLIANPEGLSKRRGHTEAAITLCQLARIEPAVAVITELQNSDGTMKNRRQCYTYAQSASIPMISISQLAQTTSKLAQTTSKLAPMTSSEFAQCRLKSKIGDQNWRILCWNQHKVFIYPAEMDPRQVVPVRIHSECFTGDVFQSCHCDCGDQLEQAMRYIVDRGVGIIIFPANQEGRGIGFVNKVRAYALQQEKGLNTFEANQELGFEPDGRTYTEINSILDHLGVMQIELLTENPSKVAALADRIVATNPVIVDPNPHNQRYLQDKRDHFLIKGESPSIDISTVDTKSIRIGFVYAMWHETYITQIRDRLRSYLQEYGVTDITEIAVPGSNEIPFQAAKLAKDVDGVICIGILIKGDTLHFENISTGVANGIMQAQVSTGVPMLNCILSCLNMEQVVDRIDGEKSTLGYIARSMVYMIGLNK